MVGSMTNGFEHKNPFWHGIFTKIQHHSHHNFPLPCRWNAPQAAPSPLSWIGTCDAWRMSVCHPCFTNMSFFEGWVPLTWAFHAPQQTLQIGSLHLWKNNIESPFITGFCCPKSEELCWKSPSLVSKNKYQRTTYQHLKKNTLFWCFSLEFGVF